MTTSRSMFVPSRHGSRLSLFSRYLTVVALGLLAVLPQADAAVGGPDAYGYTYSDSVSGGVTYGFEDISATGTIATTVSDTDDEVQNVPMGFSFNYYGSAFTTCDLCANGFIGFNNFGGALGSASYNIQSVTNPALPNSMIAGFWVDLHPGQAGSVFYRTIGTAPNRRFIVQFQGVQERFVPANLNTFQYKLFETTNKIEVHYQTLATGSNGTIGIEDASGAVGLQYSTGGLPATGRPFAIRFSPTRVTNGNDSGFGSLRQAIADVPAGGSVVLDPALSGQTVTLTSGELVVSNSPWNVARWSSDADSGLSSALTYTHAYNFGTATSATINGVTLTGVAGGSPSAANFTLTGAISALNGDPNNLPAGTGSRALATDFVYGGNPATLTLTGLTAGQSYRTSIFSVGFDLPGVRRITFAANGVSQVVDQGAYADNNGVRVDYEFVANGASQVITLTPLIPASTCHIYGFANAVVPAGFANRLNINASALPAGLTVAGNNASRVFTITAGSAATIDSLTITGGGLASGAGILNSGILTLNRSTVTGNNSSVGNWGGGIYNAGGYLTATHCTVANNAAGYGGGIFSDGRGIITHTTITQNSAATNGGGLWLNDNTLTIHNTVVGLNVPNNAIPAGLSILTQTGVNITAGDPMLLPLGNYGGPTQTMPPQAGSPVIDPASGATTSTLTVDQRGYPRVVGVRVDSGAVEAGPSITVANGNDSGVGSLRQAIADATSPGHRILFAAGLSGTTISLTSAELAIPAGRSISIDASSLAGGITINGNNARRAFSVPVGALAAINGLTITNCRAAGGGAIVNAGGLTLNNVTLSANTSTAGGGAIQSIGTLGLTNCTLASNTASYAGALFCDAGTTSLIHTTLVGNTGTGGTGGLVLSNAGTKVVLRNTIIANNIGLPDPDIGGASATLVLEGNNVIGKNTGNYTAVMPAGSPNANGDFVGTGAAPANPLLAPLGNYGGPTQTLPPIAGSVALNSAVTVAGSPSADQRGNVRPLGAAADLGAVESNFDLVVTTNANTGAGSLREALAIAIPGTTITFAAGLNGQTITLGGTELAINKNLTINGSSLASGVTISGNNASRVFNIAGGSVVTMDSLTITGGNAANGGAVFNSGTLNLANSTLSGNTSSGTGGAIFNQGALSLVHCSLTANVSASEGGAILNNSTGLTLTHCTVTGNTANGYSLGGGSAGGGIFGYNGLTLNQCIVSGNTSVQGGDVMVFGGNSLSRVGANLVGVVSASSITGAGTISNASPLLAPLGNYGGPTRTMPPLPGSPAIDAAIVSPPTGPPATVDQRGFPRPLGTANDIGAVEAANLGTLPVLNSATISPLPALTWSGASGATFEVFLGTTAGSLVSQGVRTSPFTPTTALVPGTPYFWRVDTTLAGKTYRGVEMSFTVRSVIVVTTAADENNGMTVGGVSLRDAIADAAASGTPEIINFAPALSGQTITLTNGRLVLAKSLQINASALSQGITIDANGAVTGHQVFDIDAAKTITLDSLTITGGRNPGAGIRNRGILTLNRCAVINNHAPGNYGGGIFNESGTLTATNSTIANNSGYAGGGVFSDGTATLTHTTIAGNMADFGGGVWRHAGTTTLTHSIVSANTSPNGADAANGVTESGVNLIGGDAKLTPLGYYGGPTPTMHPLAASSAIEPASGAATSALTTDQRGFTRVVGGKVDIGAVEAGPAITVLNTNDTGAGSLRQAIIDATVSGQRILFAPALNGGLIRLIQSEFVISGGRRLFVDASGLAAGVTLSGEDARRLFYLQPNAVAALHGLTVRAGKGGWGGALANEGSLTLSHVAVVASTSTGVGGGIWSIGTLVLTNCTVANNTAAGEGGGISAALVANSLTLRNCTVTGNQSGVPGGGINMANGSLHLINSLIAGNNGGEASPDLDGVVKSRMGVNFIGDPDGASGLGTVGADYLTGDPWLGTLGSYGGPTPTIPLLQGSPAIDRGAMVAGTPTFDQRGRSRVADGDGNGSAIPDIGAYEVGTTIVNTVADSGAGSLRSAIEGPDTGHEWILFDPAVFNGTPAATIVLSSQLSVTNRSLHLDASRITGGVTLSGNGSARVMLIDPASKVEIDRMTITNGFAGPGQRGGGVFNQGTLSIRNSTISNNYSGQYGGGIDNSGTLNVTNCTVANNTAASNAGGIMNLAAEALFITHTTLSGNASGADGGGIWSKSPMSLSNTLIAGNRAMDGNDVFGEVTTNLGGNLVGDGTSFVGLTNGQNGNQIGTGSAPLDAKLAPLGNYGGHTATMALLVGSPAINGGVATGTIPPLDQRGYARVGQADIGAHEAGPVILVTNSNDSGAGSLRRAINNASVPGTRILFNLSSTNSVITLTSGDITVNANQTIFIDASSLVDEDGIVVEEPNPQLAGAMFVPGGISVSGNNVSRVFSIAANGTAAMQRMTVRNGNNGGILNQGKLTLIASTIKDNSGTNGGGIQNSSGTLVIHTSTLSGNAASAAAGGILMSGGTLWMETSTVANNTAGTGAGAGISLAAAAVGTIRHSTVAANRAGITSGTALGAGILTASTLPLVLENCLVADNLAQARVGGANAPSDVSGSFRSVGANLVEAHASGTITGPTPLTADPALAGLADNGGQTLTMAFVGNSAAADVGVPAFVAPFSDQRGFARILAGGLDLGAFESGTGTFNLAGLSLYARVPALMAGAGVNFEISADPNFLPVVTTLAGMGDAGFVDGAALDGKFAYPSGVAQDSLGNIFIADSANNRIRMLTPDGMLSTIAGTGSYGMANGPGHTAVFAFPSALAVGPDDSVYVSDTYNHRLCKLTRPTVDGLPWTVSTLAGTGTGGFLNGSGSVARFNYPYGLVVDVNGFVYVADSGNHRIRKVAPNGVVSTHAGSGVAGFFNSNTPGLALFDTPQGLALVGDTLFVADRVNHRIRKITAAGQVTTFAGSAVGYVDAGGTSAQFNHPSSIAADSVGNLFVADEQNQRIRKITSAGVVSTVAGLATAGAVNGNSIVAQFNLPTGLLVAQDGNLIVADTRNHQLRRITIKPITVAASLIAGSQTPAGVQMRAVLDAAALGLDPSVVWFFRTRMLATGSTQPLGENFYLFDVPTIVTEPASNLIPTSARLNATVDPHGSTTQVTFEYSTDPQLLPPYGVTALAGSGVAGFLDSATPATAQFRTPQGLAVYNGSVYVADRTNHRIRKIAANGQVTTFAGSTAGFANATGTSAKFENPASIAVDQNGNFYVADEYNHRIRKITEAGVVTTLAGSGVAGFADGAAAAAQFVFPSGVAVDSAGNLYVADTGNHRIRKITIATGVVSTIAGSGVAGFSDAEAASAQFASPQALAVNSGGEIIIADTGNHRIRMLNSADAVITLAGTGTAGFLDGSNSLAQFAAPTGVAVDAAGSIYVADRDNHRIRLLATDGQVSTLAGSGIEGTLNSPAVGLYPVTATQFSLPAGIAIDATGSLYISQPGLVRKMARGVLPTLTVTPSPTGTGERLVGANITQPLLPDATYYFRARAVNGRGPSMGSILSFVTPQAAITMFAGANTSAEPLVAGQTEPVGFGTTPRGTPVMRQFTIANPGGWPLTVSAVNVPAGYQLAGGTGTVAAGGSLTFNVSLQAVAAGTYGGNLTVTSSAPGLGTFTIPLTGLVLAPPAVTTLAATAVTATSATLNATINPEDSSTTGWFEWSPDPEFDGVAVTTLAGSTAGDVDGPAATARFNQPTGVASDHLGNRYIADSKNHRIRKIAPDGTVSTVAGTGVAGFAEGLGNVAQFNEPIGVVLNAAGVLFVTDSKNHRIRAISTGGNVTTHAGLGEPGFTDGVGTAARFSTPQGLALSADGSLLVADRDNHRIRKVAPDGTVSTFVGTGTAGALNGAANVAQFSSPQAIATGLAGVVFVTETTSHAIRKIAADGATSVFAGAVAAAGFLEGVGVAARFANPVGVTVDANGDLFVADRGNHRIRKIAGDGAVSTFAGTAVAGLVDGPGETAQFNQPVALAVTGPGALVVGELGLSTIRRLAPTRVVMQVASNLTGGDDLPVVLPISGLATATTYYFRAFATNGGGTTYGAILSFGGAASQSPFQSWQTDQFGEDASNETISGPLASPSKDGVSNLLKYAFGLDPHEPATGGLPTTALVGGQLTLTYTQVLAATDLDYTPEWSNDLITWSAEGITEGIIGSPPPGSPTQQVRASIPMGAAKAKFIRLNVRIQQP